MSTTKRLQREARWRAIIKRQVNGLDSAAGFCRREGLAVSTFHWWRRRLGSQVGESVQWIDVEDLAPVPAGLAGTGPAVRVGTGCGLWIEFAAPPAAEVLCAALHALRLPEGRSSC